MLPFLAWWATIQVFGLAALPLAQRVFAWLPDRGYAFGKTVGLLLVSYLLWLGASTGILTNTSGGILLALLLVAGLSIWVGVLRAGSLADLRAFWNENKAQVLVVELLFLLCFAGWALVRAYAPDKILPAGGEKYMEIGFLNGVLNSPHFPPLDPWMAGQAISYYYFGYVMMAVMARFSGVAPTISFDLYDALIFALTAITAYGVVSNLVASAYGNRGAAGGSQSAAGGSQSAAGGSQSAAGGSQSAAGGSQSAAGGSQGAAGGSQSAAGGSQGAAGGSQGAAGGSQSIAARIPLAAASSGLLASLLVTVMGNLEGLLEGLYSARLLPAAFWEWIDIPDLLGSVQNGSFYPGHTWWWWRASRVLHDLDLGGQPVIFQPIDEFPFFSFLLGDNHPHKLALPFVLLVVGLAFNLLARQISLAGQQGEGPTDEALSPEEAARQKWATWAAVQIGSMGLYLFYALALGSLLFLNTWDFPISLGLVLLAYTAGQLLTGEPFRLRLLGQVAILGAGFGGGAILLYVFFFLSFSSQAGGVLPYAFLPTRLPQYLVMFGPFIFILAFFITGAALRANHGYFPLRNVLRAWSWITGVCFGILLALLLAAVVLISHSGLESSPYIQTWLGGMRLGEGFTRALLARVSDPWLFLLLSSLLAAIVAAIFPRGVRPQRLHTTLANLPYGQSQGQRPTDTQPDRPATLFALLVAFAGLALTLVVEFVYLRDNFGMRMNTIFKFYYQGWVMMACASAYGAWWVLCHTRKWARALFAVGAAMLVAGGLAYPLLGTYSRVEGFSNPPNLDAAASFAGAYPHHWAAQPDDWAAIQWLSQNGRDPDGNVPRILEAGSGGYENAGRISAFTGFPTILGWTNHEGQWRGNNIEIDRRSPDIRTIFTTAYGSVALELLHKWQVRYVIIGNTERAYIVKLCQEPANACNPERALAKFDTYFTNVFTWGSTTIYQVPDIEP